MVGTVEVSIRNRKVGYKFSLNRKFSFLEGNSSSGKTTLYDMVRRYNNDESFRRITSLNITGCNGVITADTMIVGFYDFIKNNSGYLIIIDEPEVRSLKIGSNAKELNISDNYFLIITRKPLGYLAYSYLSIFELDKTYDGDTVINVFKNRYCSEDLYGITPDLVITEDTKSGFQFFNSTLLCSVKPSEGKSDVINKVRWAVKSNLFKCIYVIVDGAAYGSEMSQVYKYLTSKKYAESSKNVYVFLPESFEYLLLKTYVFEIDNLKDKLDNTQDYCDAGKYFSWERYYTHLMKTVGYSKSELKGCLLEEDIVKGVYRNIPDLDNSVVKETNIEISKKVRV